MQEREESTLQLREGEGLEAWLDQYGDQLLRLCTLYLKDVHLAEDAVQDTFLKAWRSREQFRGESSAKTWLTRIAINVCKGYLRSPWKRRREPADIMDQLPYREVILLHYYQQLKAREIAQLLHIPLSTVTVRLSRARQQLRDELKGWYYDEEAGF